MIESVTFVPRYVIEDLVLTNEYAVISITDNDQANAIINGTNHLLRVQFLDLEQPIVHEKFKSDYLFNEEKAKAITQFVSDIHYKPENKHVKYMLIHCEAGVSRSAAVALFVYNFTKCQFASLKDANYANKLVIKILGETNNLEIKIPDRISEEEEIILLSNNLKNIF